MIQELIEICEITEDGKQVYRNEKEQSVIIVELDDYLALIEKKPWEELYTECNQLLHEETCKTEALKQRVNELEDALEDAHKTLSHWEREASAGKAVYVLGLRDKTKHDELLKKIIKALTAEDEVCICERLGYSKSEWDKNKCGHCNKKIKEDRKMSLIHEQYDEILRQNIQLLEENKALKEIEGKPFLLTLRDKDAELLRLRERVNELEDMLGEVNQYIKSAHGINTIAKGSRLHLAIQLALTAEEVCKCNWDKLSLKAFKSQGVSKCKVCRGKIKED